MGTTTSSFGLYQLPYTSSAISVNKSNLQKCLKAATPTTTTSKSGTSSATSPDIPAMRTCIQNNVFSATSVGTETGFNVKYFGPGETVTSTTIPQQGFTAASVSKTIQPAPSLPMSQCYEGFDSNNNNDNDNSNSDVNIESNKIFCFNGTFTLMTIAILILLLIFINMDLQKSNKMNLNN
jgi:hypothetical protein